jgi:hypothetical protein
MPLVSRLTCFPLFATGADVIGLLAQCKKRLLLTQSGYGLELYLLANKKPHDVSLYR